MDDLLVDLFLEADVTATDEIILDVDATDDPVHGQQEGRFFHGYDCGYGSLPLYLFCDEHLLCARLRPADQDGAASTKEELAHILERVRLRGPQTRMIVRGDSGFCRDDLLTWCEAHDVDSVLGLAQNSRLTLAIAAEMAQAKEQDEMTQQAARAFRDFRYRTHTSWSCERRVIGKAEQLAKGANPRFVVTRACQVNCVIDWFSGMLALDLLREWRTG
jgi:DDE family transposase